MIRRLVLSPWSLAAVLAIGLAFAVTTQSSADTSTDRAPSSDKTTSTDKLVITPSTTNDSTNVTPTKKTKAKTKKASSRTSKKKHPVPASKLKLDPKAPHVNLFDGMKQGALTVKMVPQNSLGGSVLIENSSQQPLTVDLPDAFVGVQVLRQFAGGGGRGNTGAGGAAGGAQAAGGGFGGGMGGMQGGFGGMGGGQFSVPPETTAKVPYHSVCLQHGKTDPDSTMTYRVMPVADFSSNEQLGGLLTMIGRNAIDPQVAQAAAWNIASNMSWDELAAKNGTEPGTNDMPYFSREALFNAQQLVIESRAVTRELAEKAAKQADAPKKDAPSKSEDHVVKGR